MASAPVTLAGSQTSQFLADGTVQKATLQGRGGTIVNNSGQTIWIAEGQLTIATDGTDQNSVSIPTGAPAFALAPTTAFFAFKAGASSGNVTFIPRGF